MAFVGPGAGVDVVDDGARGREIERDRGELGRGPALQEQHLVVGRDGHQLAEVGFGLLGNADVGLAAMAHLHDRHAVTVPVEHLVAQLFQHFDGQRGGAGAEIEHTGHEAMLRKGFSHRSLAGATHPESVNAASAYAAA